MDLNGAVVGYTVFWLTSRMLLATAEILWMADTILKDAGPQMNETPPQWLRATAVALLPLAGDVFLCFYAAVWLAWAAEWRRPVRPQDCGGLQ